MSLQPCYVLIGSEPVRKRYLLGRLRAQAGSWESVSAAETSPDEVLAPSLLADPDTPAVKVVDEYAKWTPAQRKLLAAGLQDPTPGICIIVCVPRLGDKDVLRSAVQADALIGLESPKPGGFSSWAAKQAQLEGLQINHPGLERLVGMVGEDTEALASEIAKLAAAHPGMEVGAEQVERLVVDAGENRIWDWLQAMLDGNQKLAMQCLATCESSQETVFALTAALNNRLTMIAWVHCADQQSSEAKDYPWRQASSAAKSYWNTNNTAAGLEAVSLLEQQLKGGSSLPPYVQLARFTAIGIRG